MITPQQAENRYNEIHEKALAAIESRIDEALARGERCLSSGIIDYRYRAQILERYRAAGWKVDFTSDQKDGDYYTFNSK